MNNKRTFLLVSPLISFLLASTVYAWIRAHNQDELPSPVAIKSTDELSKAIGKRVRLAGIMIELRGDVFLRNDFSDFYIADDSDPMGEQLKIFDDEYVEIVGELAKGIVYGPPPTRAFQMPRSFKYRLVEVTLRKPDKSVNNGIPN